MPSMRSEKRRRTMLVAVRMTPAEKQQITDAAQEHGISVGAFLRQSALIRAPLTKWID